MKGAPAPIFNLNQHRYIMSDVKILEKDKTEQTVKKDLELPGKYDVIFLNDNHTPMDFVTEVLIQIFKHNKETAEHIMFDVHEKGSGVAGTYSYEIAEQKTAEATMQARQQGFPLAIHIEKAK